MNMGDLNKVWEIRALKRKPLEDEAKQFLEKIAKQVQPIIRNHHWRVKLLSEFCPNNPALLGLNVGGGIHVKLRLRRPNRDLDFLPFDQVLDTMLHELCHNAHGPHNASFYKLWDELRKECEELISKGISGTGAGFDLPGRRLGGFSRQPSLSSLRQTVLAAAEKRVKLGSILPSGPNRLGGDSTIMSALSPIQAAAMAAERRLQDEIWCGSHSSETLCDEENVPNVPDNSEYQDQVVGRSGQSNHRKRNHKWNDDASSVSLSGDSGSNVVDICQNNSRSSVLSHRTSPKRKFCKARDDGHASPTFVEVISVDSSPGPSTNHDAAHNPCEPAMWECRLCTLLNPPLAPLCGMCSTEKPTDISTKHHLWSCKFCTLQNSATLDRCLACDQWRYSHGPPVSTKGPNLGT